MYPNFIILGPPKCASSSLHFYLGQHPEIYTSKIKETKFFSQDYSKGLSFYESYFKDAGNAKVIGESTPVYSFLPFVADHIKHHFPQMKMILCFRNPMDRAFSSWMMQKGMGKELLSLREAIEINRKQLGYVTLEGEEGEKKWISSMGIYTKDETRLRTYIQAGMYAASLKSYYKRFSPEQIKVIFLEDLKSDFDGTMKTLFRFLGVDENFVVPNKEIVNFHFDRKASKITNKLFGVNGTKFLISLTPKSVKNKLKKQWKTKVPPKLSMEDRLYLWEIYKADIAELEKMVGKSLAHWNPVLKEKLAVQS